MMDQLVETRYGIEDVFDEEFRKGSYEASLPYGDVFSGRALCLAYSRAESGLIDILGPCAGWLTYINNEGDMYAAIPDLERLLNACRESATPVMLVNEAKFVQMGRVLDPDIPANTYGRVIVEDEAHPVSVVADFSIHWHDIGIDHFPAPAVVGKGLFELLIPGSGKRDFVGIAKAYDESTQEIRASISDYLGRNYKKDTILTTHRRADIEKILGLSPKFAKSRLDKLEELIRLGLERLELV